MILAICHQARHLKISVIFILNKMPNLQIGIETKSIEFSAIHDNLNCSK